MRILIVDDARDARELLARVLQRWNHEVISAVNGEDAWAKIQQDPVRLVISD